MLNISIVTASFENNHYLEIPLHKKCIESWQNLKKNIESKNCKCDIKIFDWDSEILKNFKENVLPKLEIKNLNIQTRFYKDIFECWYLSENPYTLWLDCDIYTNKNVDFNINKPHIHGNFGDQYNYDKTFVYKDLLELFKNSSGEKDNVLIAKLLDTKTYPFFINKNYAHYKNFEHLGMFADRFPKNNNYKLIEYNDRFVIQSLRNSDIKYTLLKIKESVQMLETIGFREMYSNFEQKLD